MPFAKPREKGSKDWVPLWSETPDLEKQFSLEEPSVAKELREFDRDIRIARSARQKDPGIQDECRSDVLAVFEERAEEERNHFIEDLKTKFNMNVEAQRVLYEDSSDGEIEVEFISKRQLLSIGQELEASVHAEKIKQKRDLFGTEVAFLTITHQMQVIEKLVHSIRNIDVEGEDISTLDWKAVLEQNDGFRTLVYNAALQAQTPSRKKKKS